MAASYKIFVLPECVAAGLCPWYVKTAGIDKLIIRLEIDLPAPTRPVLSALSRLLSEERSLDDAQGAPETSYGV